jgi:predicted transposase YbfD/YdcC
MSKIPLISVFSRLEDPRSGPAQRHDLREMIVIALCAILCGAESWADVAEWGEDNEAWLKKYLELAHGTASHDTFSRVFRLLDARVFEACFLEWVMSLVGVVAGVVAIDGKTVRGSQDGPNTALHMISAYATASGLCLAQKILERGGDYLLAVKENQPSLAGALREFFDEGETNGYGRLPVSRCETVEKDHGRIETRRALWITDLSWMDAPLRERWPKLSGVGMLERTCETKGKVSCERAYFIGSKGGACAEAFATAASRHWGIENSLHWVLDVTFREDGCRVRKGHAPQNFSAFSQIRVGAFAPGRDTTSVRLT